MSSASRAGKIVPVMASSPEEMTHYYNLGARLFPVGVDITMKRRALTETIARLQVAKPQ